MNELNIAKIIGGLNKALDIVNKALPLYNDFKPFFKNASSIAKIFKAMNTDDDSANNNTNKVLNIHENTNSIKDKKIDNNLPTFFQ